MESATRKRRIMSQTTNTEIFLDKSGATMMVVGSISWISDKLNLISFNDVLTGVSLILGIIWMVFRIKNEILTGKIKKQTIEQNEK